MSEPRCEDCGRILLVPYDFSGESRRVVACFDCDPPRILCERCADLHPTHRIAGPDDGKTYRPG
jgi:hypothetical protein